MALPKQSFPIYRIMRRKIKINTPINTKKENIVSIKPKNK